jgi:trehalose synthase
MRQRVQNACGWQNVFPGEKSVGDYAAVVGDVVVAEMESLARPLRGARIAHISTTACGGVAEMLHTLVPLMNNVGLEAQWRVIPGREDFFNVAKSIRNAFRGRDVALTPLMRAAYLHANMDNAASFEDEFDFIIVHDPQLVALRMLRTADSSKWIWRCHTDLTAASPTYWSFLRPFIQMYDAAVFTHPSYVRRDLRVGKIAIIPPAIDPLSPKNEPMDWQKVASIAESYGVDPKRPTLTQVSRFDPWKDPLGAIEVYRTVKRECPTLQLVLIGSLAHDDPEGMRFYQRTKDFAADDSDIHLLSNLEGIGNVEVNAFQRQATVILQKSLYEGFGLAVSEGLWKAKPVIGGNVGGIPLQIQDGVSGYLVDNTAQCAARVLDLLANPERSRVFGEQGHMVVRHNFLATANLRNYLKLLSGLARADGATLRDLDGAEGDAMPLSAPSFVLEK